MTTLTEKMNIKYGTENGAWVIKNCQTGINAYDTLCLICAELNVNLADVDDVDFETASDTLDSFVKKANAETGYTVSVWF